jgi:hypothetical protein
MLFDATDDCAGGSAETAPDRTPALATADD